MYKTVKKNIGAFEFLKQKNHEKLSKRLLSVEFRDMPFFRYAVLMSSLLEGEFFFRALIIGKAQRQYDLTWLLKDFSIKLDFVSTEFSHFEIEPELFKEVNFIEVDNILNFKTENQYDLIVLIEDYNKFIANEKKYYQLLSSLISSISSRVIFILNHSVPKQEKEIKLNIHLAGAFIKTFELKHYSEGQLKIIDFIIATRGIALK